MIKSDERKNGAHGSKTSLEPQRANVTAADLAGAQRFVELTRGGTDIGRFVRCHLVLEQVLTSALERAATDARVMEIDRFRFSDKARLAAGFGLIRPAYLTTILAVNAVRNNLVHRLEAALTDEDFRRLMNSMPADMHISAKELWKVQNLPLDRTAIPMLMAYIVGAIEESIRAFSSSGPINSQPAR